MTRTPAKAGVLHGLGAHPVVCDAFDADAVHAAVRAAAPEVVVNALTALPDAYDARHLDRMYEQNTPLWRETPSIIVSAARAAGARRLIAQSVAFYYAPAGEWVKDECDALWTDAPPPFREPVGVIAAAEHAVLEAAGIEGVVLRCGLFYGPGTWWASDGSVAMDVRRRRFPIVGRGDGVFSWIHVDDVAAATSMAVDRGGAGVYNVVDDEPVAMSEWLPLYASALGAPRPLRIPRLIARLAAPAAVIDNANALRGASNAKIKRELGWTPQHTSWRTGFINALG